MRMRWKRWLCAAPVAVAGACVSSPPFPAAHPVQSCTATSAEQSMSPPPPTPLRLRYRSSFWLNLHNVLHQSAKRQRGIRDEGLGGLGLVDIDSLRSRPLAPPESRAWDALVSAFAALVYDDGLEGDLIRGVSVPLSHATWPGTLVDVAVDARIEAILVEAAPIYAEVWWPAHDAYNRVWIGRMQSLRQRLGPCAENRVAALLRGTWPSEPIVVDASVYANWFGAYTVLDPPHITMSSNGIGNQETAGVEGLLHEAAHTLLPRVDGSLRASGERLARRVPPQMAHLLLFYTVGSVVREYDGEHIPNGRSFGIWEQNSAAVGHYRRLREQWWPYLAGRRPFGTAVDDLVRTLPRTAAGKG